MVAIARLGVADSLAAGITTTADYSFSGAAAAAAAELGLRAIVYLEVFGADPAAAERRFDGAPRAGRGDRARPDRHLAPRAVHLLARGLPLLPLARDPGRHPPRRERRRERVARSTAPARSPPAAEVLVAADRQAGGRDARGAARPGAPLRPLRRASTTSEIGAPRGRRRPGRPLPALERAARLRDRPARRAPRRRASASASAPTRPPRRPRSTPGTSCGPRVAGARARERRPDALMRRGCPAPRYARMRRRRSGSTETSGASRLANAPT